MQINFKYISTRSGKSLILNIEAQRYVFNIFEGFQRYAIEQGVSLKGIDTVFLPNVCSVPPFLGYCLTVRDMQKCSLNIVCDENITNIIRKSESICPTKHLTLNYQQDFEDSYIKVSACNAANAPTQNYILEFKSFSGKLLVDKIPKHIPKRLYSALKEGKDVAFEGSVYKGTDYIDPSIDIGKWLLVFGEFDSLNEYDNEDYNSVLCFDPLQFKKIKNKFTNCAFMALNDNIEFESHYKIQIELNEIDKNFLLPVSNKSKEQILLKDQQKVEESSKRKRLRSKCQTFNSGDEIIYDKTHKNFRLLKHTSQNFSSSKNKVNDNSLVFLGTGCAIPSKYRNVSAVLYNINNTFVLFDCGEDTLGQIQRLYGADEILNKLKYIFISHSHADHCLGIINLLKKIKHKIIVIAPSILIAFLQYTGQRNIVYFDTTPAKELEQYFYKDLNIPQGDFDIFKSNLRKGQFLGDNFGGDIGQYTLEICDKEFRFLICGVNHTPDSCSVSLVYDEHIKISYSGDTRPSPLFTCMALESDVLIHESTFNNGNLDKAIKTRHSTIKEANAVFNLSQSSVLLLTHFSQRHSKGFISHCEGIPCMDFYKYVIGKTKFNKAEINAYLKSLKE